MERFIDRLAAQLLEKYAGGIDQLCVVFPSRRATLFFRDCLLKKIKKPLWSPDILSIEEFIRELSEATLLDNVSLTFELFPLYQEHFPEQSFDQFYSWGNTLVNDFDELDRYEIDVQSLFKNLFELKQIDATIESWLPAGNEPSLFQRRYLDFWELMGSFYEDLRKKLLGRGYASPGMALRDLALQISREIPQIKWEKVIFAGFNVLVPAEERLVRALVDWGLAECYWDMDRYFIEDEEQEAGRFFRQIQKRWGKQDWNWVDDQLGSEEKEITLTGVPMRVGQAKIAGLVIQDLLQADTIEETTAIVLPDENLLFPLLHSLPEEIKEINVTMGFPLRNTPLYSLVEGVLNLHENADRLKSSPGAKTRFYFRDIHTLLRHPYINSLVGADTGELIFRMRKENRVYLEPDFFNQQYGENHFFRFFFQDWSGIDQVVAWFLELFQTLKLAIEETGSRRVPAVESEFLYQFYTLTQKLRDKLGNYPTRLDLKTFRRLYREVIHTATIPFSGEPLKGLQIMGMLETRVLDFEKIILLSVNEGILPATRQSQTFIPYNLRKAFGLPTYEDQDAIYAYHFYRLLKRAKTVHLLYNTENDTFGSGEKSRFLAQLEAELARRNPNIKFENRTMTFDPRRQELRPIVVDKTPEVLKSVEEFAREKGFSPSAMSTYLNCSLKFYFRYILHLKEPEGPEESLEADTFGSIVHQSLEELFEPYLASTVQTEDIQRMDPLIESVVEKHFKEATQGSNPDTGRNHLLLGVIANLIRKLLEVDQDTAPFELEGLEQELELELPLPGKEIKVKLRGIIDRIDKVKGQVRIIDYKTGRVGRLVLEDFVEIREGKKKREAFQLTTYAYLYLKTREGNLPVINAGIYALRNLSAGLKLLETGPTRSEQISQSVLIPFEDQLLDLFTEILNPAKPFVQAEEQERCLFCPYTVICSRT